MNYDEARPLKDGGWHWTTMNDGRIRTAPPCIRLTNGDWEHPEFERCEPHATQEEAEHHLYVYSLSEVRERTWTSAHRCEAEGCEEWADKTLENDHFGQLFSAGTFLCDAHRTPEMLAELHPFQPGIRLIHS